MPARARAAASHGRKHPALTRAPARPPARPGRCCCRTPVPPHALPGPAVQSLGWLRRPSEATQSLGWLRRSAGLDPVAGGGRDLEACFDRGPVVLRGSCASAWTRTPQLRAPLAAREGRSPNPPALRLRLIAHLGGRAVARLGARAAGERSSLRGPTAMRSCMAAGETCGRQ